MQHIANNETLTLLLVQFDICWENIDRNLETLSDMLSKTTIRGDLILLPEMFSTGFTMNTYPWKEENRRSLEWMKKTANEKNALVCGSLIFSSNNSKDAVNRFFAVFPDQHIVTYDKRHLFRMAGEDQYYTPGNKKVIFTYKGWNISPYICYDLRFPVWSRNADTSRNYPYDLALYVANWPEARIVAWDTLLKARAIENSCYVAGVNRTGTDGNGIVYSGHSSVYDFKGDTLASSAQPNVIITCTLNKYELTLYRSKFPTHLDADKFSLQP